MSNEGNVGGGTGMTCYDWKGGIGTSSRLATVCGTDDDLGQNRHVHRRRTRPGESGHCIGTSVIRGVPVGKHLEATTQSPGRTAEVSASGEVRKSSDHRRHRD